MKIHLASDNWSPVHPEIIKSLIEANSGFAPAYGGDEWTFQAEKAIQETFKSPCKVFMIPTGTGANVLALRIACRRYESVICTDVSHIAYQESGAAESLVGCKLLTVPHQMGKVTWNALDKKLRTEKAFGKHSTFPRLLSITQPTEVGTIYTMEELQALSKACQEQGLLLHIDGSRFYNAAAALNLSLHEMIGTIQVDLLSLGGTKNGLMGVESLIIFNSSLWIGSDHLQKQTLQLPSKMRFYSAQFLPFFNNNLWKTLALTANFKAFEIAEILKSIPEITLSYPVETNQIFFRAPPPWIPKIQEKIFCYPWDLCKNEIRFITSWNTSCEEVKAIEKIMASIN